MLTLMIDEIASAEKYLKAPKFPPLELATGVIVDAMKVIIDKRRAGEHSFYALT